MKLTAILFFIVFVTFGNSFSQVRLTVNFNQTDIRVMSCKPSKNKTGLHFFVQGNNIFDFSQKITANFTEAKFDDVLKNLLRSNRYHL